MTYPSGVSLSYQYDTQGRLSNIDRDGQALVSDIAYDPFGPVTGWHWSDGSTERRDYDLDGRLTKQTLGASERTLDFDPNGNITALSDPHTDFQFDYDALNRLIVANDSGTALSWIYDANGNRLSEALDGILSNYQYETGSNRLNQINSRSYSHDANGNRINDGSHSYGYNSDNRLISVDDGATARYRHNALGQRIAKLTFAGGDATDYLALAEAAEKAAQAHRETAASHEAQAQQAEAEAASLNTQAVQAQAQSDQLAQEANDLTTAANEAKQSADEHLQEAADLREKAADYRAKIDPDPSNFWQRIKNAIYKALANLADSLAENAEEEAQPFLTQSEDLIRQADNKQAEAEQLLQQASDLQQQAQALLATAAQQTQAAEEERILAQQAEVQAAEYRRLADTTGGTVETQTLFVYDESGRLIGEYDSSGLPIQETVYLSELPIATLQGGDTYRIHSDHLGTPRVITDQNQKEVWRWDAKPFGDSPANEDPDQDGTELQFNLRFPGQYYDAETGLHYNYFRDYDSSTGRYLQSDPIGLVGGLNTFVYVNSKPLQFIDRFGLRGDGGLGYYEEKRQDFTDRFIGDITGRGGLSGPFNPDVRPSGIRSLSWDAFLTGTRITRQYQQGNISGGLNSFYSFLGIEKIMKPITDSFGQYIEDALSPSPGTSGIDGISPNNSGQGTNKLDRYIEPDKKQTGSGCLL
jgi:RHS repeat-associated protein